MHRVVVLIMSVRINMREQVAKQLWLISVCRRSGGNGLQQHISVPNKSDLSHGKSPSSRAPVCDVCVRVLSQAQLSIRSG
jgi:hypothetical protein